MSKDAQFDAALESLATDLLPRLAEQMVTLMGTPSASWAQHPAIAQAFAQTLDMLNVLAPVFQAHAPATSESSTQATVASPPGEMSDEEARRLLAEMDGEPSSAKVETPPAPLVAERAPSGEMSDEEARRLLAAMDEPAPDNPAVGASPAPLVEAAAGAPQNDAQAAAPVAEEGEIDEWRPSEFQNDQVMLTDFITTGGELMESLDDLVLKLEQNPTDKETIESIFRSAHTLKGTAAMFGFAAIERVMHRMENLFDLIRKDKLVPNSDTIDVVFQGLDILRTLLEAVKNGKPCGVKTAPVVQALTLAALGKKSNLSPRSAKAVESNLPAVGDAPQASVPGTNGGDGAERKGGAAAAKKNENSTIRVDLERLDALVNLVGELVIDRTRFATLDEELRTKHPQLKLANNLTETVQLFGRHMNDVQDIIMKVRMVPIGNAFNKFPRVVRDLARQLNKEMDLVIKGETTELDKTLVEMIADPLVHLVRNSCDHGIEMPDVRKAAGKSPAGKITLTAAQEGNHIVITIEDDGKGMDPARIRTKAIEKGLIKESDQLSETEVLNLIFEPGFSTAEKVTTVSGRGVGMDVVKKQIAKLKGSVLLSSRVGQGSRVTIQLPLTLAIVQSLLVQVKAEKFAIPQSAIIESIRIQPQDIQRVGDNEVINLRNHVLPLVYLDRLMSLTNRNEDYWYDVSLIQSDVPSCAYKPTKRGERMFVVVVGSGEQRFGLIVDQLLNQQEMVIKSMGKVVSKLPCIAGGAVLGNGEVVLALDIAEIQDYFRHRGRGTGLAAA